MTCRRTPQSETTTLVSSTGYTVLPTDCQHPAHMSVGAARLGDPHTGCSAPVSPRLEEVSSEVLVTSSCHC